MSGSNTNTNGNSPDVPNGIILFWYHASPFGRRVKTYLTLRNIEHAECIQPPMLPRPDISALGVNYRRSPVMAIGRDVYLDTRLMIAKLEELFPASSEHPGLSSPETVGLAQLLQKLSIEHMFREAVKQIPQDFPLLKDPKFQKDRAGFFGPDWKMDASMREDGMVHLRHCLDILESMLADGREWIVGTERLSLADLEGIWVVDWLLNDLRPAQEFFSEKQFPKLHGWKNGFRKELAAAKGRSRRGVSLQGRDAVSFVNSSAFSDRDIVVKSDPLQLREGVQVELYPTDGGGFTHQDRGRLVQLTEDEVAIAVQSTAGQEVHVHAPRWHFKVRAVEAARL